MPWVLTNGKNYLRKNSNQAMKACNSASKAEMYQDQKSAERALMGIPKTLRKLGYHTEFVNLLTAQADEFAPVTTVGTPPDILEQLNEIIESNAKEQETQIQAGPQVEHELSVAENCPEEAMIEVRPPAETVTEEPEEPAQAQPMYRHRVSGINDDALSVENFVSKTAEFAEFLSSVDEQHSRWVYAQSQAELEIQDILHGIEFSKCNVVGGYQWYKMLRDVLQRRREYKDAQQCYEFLKELNVKKKEVSNTVRRYKGLQRRQYTPRVLTELTSYFKECAH